MHLTRVELIGFLGNDAEAKTTSNGKAVTTLSLGTKTAFVNNGQDGASLAMGLLTAVALLCQLINLFRLSTPHQAAGRSSRPVSSLWPGGSDPPGHKPSAVRRAHPPTTQGTSQGS